MVSVKNAHKIGGLCVDTKVAYLAHDFLHDFCPLVRAIETVPTGAPSMVILCALHKITSPCGVVIEGGQ